jgi:hypothetical protein
MSESRNTLPATKEGTVKTMHNREGIEISLGEGIERDHGGN